MTDQPLRRALDAAGDKPAPDAAQADKKNYAQRLSNQLAQTLGDALRPHFPTVTPAADGTGQESAIPVGKGRKRLDVKVTDPSLGLLVSISIKTYSFQDYSPSKRKLGRWTKNIVRNDHELRGEATVLHQRQPYSVLIAVMFEPVAITTDGNPSIKADSGKSSFAHHVSTLSKRSGRGKRPVQGAGNAWVDLGAEDPRYDLFERVFIGLYESDEPNRGAVRFFDVEAPPPRNGPPGKTATVSFDEFVQIVIDEVERRNRLAPIWANPDDDLEDDS